MGEGEQNQIKSGGEDQIQQTKGGGHREDIIFENERRKVEINEILNEKRRMWQKDIGGLQESFKKLNMAQEKTLEQVDRLAKESNHTHGYSIDNCYTLENINDEMKELHKKIDLIAEAKTS
jgi:hypothetical protein